MDQLINKSANFPSAKTNTYRSTHSDKSQTVDLLVIDPAVVVVFQRRKWNGWLQCAPIRWCQARIRPPFGGAASSPHWDVCSNHGNGGRRRARSSSRRLLVKMEPNTRTHTHTPIHPSSSCITHTGDKCLPVAPTNSCPDEAAAVIVDIWSCYMSAERFSTYCF